MNWLICLISQPKHLDPDRQIFLAYTFVILFLPTNSNMCFGCSKEPSNCDGSFEDLQHMFWLRNEYVLTHSYIGPVKQKYLA